MKGHDDIDDIMKRVDFDENGEINYSEFVSGTLDRSLLSRENLLKVFKYLDSQAHEVLTYDSLMRSFERRGDFNLEEFNKMMAEINILPPQKQDISPSVVDGTI